MRNIEEYEKGKTFPTAFVSTFNINIHSHSNNPFRTTSKFSFLFSSTLPDAAAVLLLGEETESRVRGEI
jgi:hypothetical protein